MTFAEFQHWLRGFSAAFEDGAPTAAQWKVIQAELAKVRPEVVTVPAPHPATLPLIPLGPTLDLTPRSGGNQWDMPPIVTCGTASMPTPSAPYTTC